MVELGFGLMRLPLKNGSVHDSVNTGAVCMIVGHFIDARVSYFDTAYYYNDDASERVIGSKLAAHHPHGSFRLTDKMSTKLIMDKSDPSVQESFLEEQMECCCVDCFNSYLLYDVCRLFHPAAKRLGPFNFLRRMRDADLAQRAGFSFHDDAGFVVGMLVNNPNMDFVQLQINYIDWDSDVI